MLYLYGLIIKWLIMKKDIKIARLEEQLAEARKQTKEAKAEARKARRELSKERKKKDAKTIVLTKEQRLLLSMLLNGTPIQDS